MDMKPAHPRTFEEGDGAADSLAAPPDSPTEPYDPTPPSHGLWWIAAVLLARWRFLALMFLLGAAGGVTVALLLPPEYMAETRVMLPSSGNTSMLGMLERVAPGASALLGGEGGEYTRYLSILTSRTLMDRAVERFRLEQVYETTDSVDPRGDAIEELLKNTSFEVALDFDYLAIKVLDREPRRAAAIANYLVAELNRENSRLTSSSAREERVFIERRLREAESALDSAQAQMQAFQERHGVLNLEQQGQAFYNSMADMRAEVARLEVEYGSLRRQYGEDNPQVQAAAGAVDEARSQVNRFLTGREAVLPVPTSALPEVGRQFAVLYQEVATQTRILEFIRPLFEQARFEQQRTASAVQVLDVAIPPARKARPQRKLVVASVALTVLLLGIGYVLGRAWVRDNSHWIAARLRSASIRA